MSVLFFLVPLSVGLAMGALYVCLRCIDSGQFKDLETPKWAPLRDDDQLIKRNVKDDESDC